MFGLLCDVKDGEKFQIVTLNKLPGICVDRDHTYEKRQGDFYLHIEPDDCGIDVKWISHEVGLLAEKNLMIWLLK